MTKEQIVYDAKQEILRYLKTQFGSIAVAHFESGVLEESLSFFIQEAWNAGKAEQVAEDLENTKSDVCQTLSAILGETDESDS